MADDFIGGMLLMGAALFTLCSVIKAHWNQSVAGVSGLHLAYLACLNIYYVPFFLTHNAPWSAVGSIAMMFTGGAWLFMWFKYR